uniref:Malonyl-CoA:ACP transacylase (MAT) domain-containing protein n=1 Tax=Medicago truncatula TaxID=3880 RepID=B7FJ29_MEDTR|nr:unknown [Medicago truncatula]
MQHLFHHSRILHNPSSFSISTMSSSLTLPSFSPIFLPQRTHTLKNHNFPKSRVFATISTGTQSSIHEASVADYKVSNAFLFPGQGAQAVGMGKEAQSVPAAALLYKKANEILGFDLLDVCINGPKEKLNSTVISQPALYVTSLAAVELLRAREGGEQIIDSVDVTCGLSLGEYTALAFAGAFSF